MQMALAEHQQAFISSFFSPTAARCQILVASPGMGKTTTALEIIAETYRLDTTSKILFIAPQVLCLQAADILQSRVLSPDSFYFSRQRIRELAATSNTADWPTRIVVVPDTVAKQADVSERLRAVGWDLIVVDEANRSPSLVQTFMPKLAHQRVLLVTSLDFHPGEEATFSQFHETRWDADQLNPTQQPNIRSIKYNRSKAEQNVMERVASLTTELNDTKEARVFRQTIQQASMSSFNALEQLLTRQLGILNDPSTASLPLGGLPEDFATREVDLTVASPWKDRVNSTEKLLALLDAIANTPVDSKLAALLVLIDGIANRRSHYGLWIVTSFRATAWYLRSSLSELAPGVNILTADMPYSRAVELSEVTSREHSILVSTLASTKGLQFPGITDVVLYDEPRTKNVLHFVRSRVPGDYPPEIFVFREDT